MKKHYFESIKSLLFNNQNGQESQPPFQKQEDQKEIIEKPRERKLTSQEFAKKMKSSAPEKLKLTEILKPKPKQTTMDEFLLKSIVWNKQSILNNGTKSSTQSKALESTIQKPLISRKDVPKEKQSKQVPRMQKTKPISKFDYSNCKFSFLKPQKALLPRAPQVKEVTKPSNIEIQLSPTKKVMKPYKAIPRARQIKEEIKLQNKIQPQPIKRSAKNDLQSRQLIIDLISSSLEQNNQIQQQPISIQIIKPSPQPLINESEQKDELIDLSSQKKVQKISHSSENNKAIKYSSPRAISSFNNLIIQTEQSFPKVSIKGLQIKDNQKYFLVQENNESTIKTYQQQYILDNYIYELIDFYESRTKFTFGYSKFKDEYDWL